MPYPSMLDLQSRGVHEIEGLAGSLLLSNRNCSNLFVCLVACVGACDAVM